MKNIVFLSLFVFLQTAISFAAQDSVSNSAANAGKNSVQKTQVVPVKTPASKTLEEEDILVDETEAKKNAPSPESTAQKKELSAQSITDSLSSGQKNAAAVADSGKTAPVAQQKADSAASASSTDTTGAPAGKEKETIAAPATVESIRSIDFAKNLKDYRSPKVAMFLSLLVPGLGQAYVKKYYKTGIFVALEATAIGFSVAFNSKGKKQETNARSFADANYDFEKMKNYYDGLYGFIRGLSEGENNADSAASAQINDIYYMDTNLNSFKEASKTKSQDFYRTIESNSYVHGWNDCQPPLTFITDVTRDSVYAGGYKYSRSDSVKYKVIRIDSATGKVVDSSLVFGYSSKQIQFTNMMSKSNSYYKTAQQILFTLVINHVLSAVDALLSAKAYNDELIGKESVWRHIGVEQQMVDVGSNTVPGCALTFRF
jgi:hypothetical protein